jgi:hypothetical protein
MAAVCQFCSDGSCYVARNVGSVNEVTIQGSLHVRSSVTHWVLASSGSSVSNVALIGFPVPQTDPGPQAEIVAR